MTSPPTVCFRHPDRVTRLSCSECGRPICAECSHDAVVGQKCPICAAPEQRTRVIHARTITHTNRRTTPLTLALIVINVAIFLVGQASPNLRQEIFNRFAQQHGWVAHGEWWRGFTAMFLHASLIHVGFNMWALWLFGPFLERRWGTVPFGALYLASGLSGAALFYVLGNQAWAVGASGAIFGLFGALMLAAYRQRHTTMGRAIFGQLLLLLAINLALPLISPSIAWEAHVGGLLAGGAIAFAWERIKAGPRASLQRTIVALCVAAAALAVLMLA